VLTYDLANYHRIPRSEPQPSGPFEDLVLRQVLIARRNLMSRSVLPHLFRLDRRCMRLLDLTVYAIDSFGSMADTSGLALGVWDVPAA
jgi:hypothetical protein